MKQLKGSSQQGRRAPRLLKADAHGPNWTDKQMAEAFSCRTHTGENVRQRLVTVGFASALHGEKPPTPPRQKRLDGAQEAQGIALRLGKPPKGLANGSLRLLAEQVVALAIVDAVSHETLRKMRKKRHDAAQDAVLGHPSGSPWRIGRVHGKRVRDVRTAV